MCREEGEATRERESGQLPSPAQPSTPCPPLKLNINTIREMSVFFTMGSHHSIMGENELKLVWLGMGEILDLAAESTSETPSKY